MTISVSGPITAPGRAQPLGGTWRLLDALTARRKLQLVLGVIWLIDAALQYQPYMFGRDFVTQTLEPAAQGTPWIVEHPSMWAAHFMIHHITLYNSFFATIQLVIALAIFYRPTLKFGLGLSVVWSVAVWWLGEGIGGVTAGATALMGAPGAVIVYAFLALLLWPSDREPEPGMSVAECGPLGRIVPKAGWAVMWISFAYLGLEAVNRSPSALYEMVDGMGSGESGWIKALDRGLAAPLAHHGTEWSIVLAVLFVLVGVAVFVPKATRSGLAVAVLLGIIIWLAEDFGQIFTGSATDVNSGPLLILFALALWPLGQSPGRETLTASSHR